MGTSTGTAAPDRALVALVSLLTVSTLELVRASGALVDLALTGGGVPAATLTALVTYLLPGPVAAVLLAVTRGRLLRRTLLGGSALLAVLRLVAQGLDGGSRFVVGLAAVAVALAVLTLAVALLAGGPGGGRAAAGALALGAAGGVGVQLALGTWDAFWRHTLLGWAVAALAVVALLAAAGRAVRGAVAADDRAPGRLWALGPWLALGAMMLANPAFAASQSGLPLALAGPLHAAGLLLAAWTLGRAGRPGPRAGRLAAGGSVVGVGAALALGGVVDGDGALVLLALFTAQLAGAHALACALRLTGAPGVRPSRLTVSAAVVGILTIGPLLAYQLDYEVPLGVPNELVLVLTAGALAVAGLGPDARALAEPQPSRLLVPVCAVVLLGASVAVLAATTSRPATTATAAAPAGSGVVVSWNLHYGVSPRGAVDLESVARTLEAQDADVVLLQEVSRGWVQGGGVDTATWLSQRLDRPFVFAPAADRRFGNAILARRPPSAVEVHALPYGAGPQRRSAISADVPLGTTTVRVTSVHLQHRAGNTPTRLRQVEALLPRLGGPGGGGPGGGGPEILAGDLNAGPGGPEVGLIGRAGFVSALDTAGDPRALTSPSPAPRRRIDWLFGRGVVFRDARVLTQAQQSDHLPLVVATQR